MAATPEDRRAYYREYMLRRYYRRKATAIQKLGGKCAKCDSTTELQFDHIDRTDKKFTICNNLVSVAESKFEAELKKCQLLCPLHHQEKTLKERGFKSAKGTHGTLSSYRYCHCELCKAAKSAYKRKRSSPNGLGT